MENAQYKSHENVSVGKEAEKMKNEELHLSVVILTKNEAEMIGACLESVQKLQPREILVIDDGSTDETVSIARKSGAKIFEHKKENFAEAREFGAKKAMGEWILYIDADERVSDELVNDIKKTIYKKDEKYGGYYLRRVNYYLGVRWPQEEQIARLFQKESLKGWFGKLHETADTVGESGKLQGALYHYTHRNLSEMVANTVVWSEIEAKLRYDAKHPPMVWWRIPRVMLTTFYDFYFKQGGWKVGTVGLIESIYQAFSMFITYARLWEMSREAGSHSARQQEL